MLKSNYKVKNWKDYNKSLIKRGSITLWVDKHSLNKWYESSKNSGKGRPKKYSDLAIEVALTLKYIYRLTLRSCQGFLESIFSIMKLYLEIPSYTQICRRQGGLKIPKITHRSESIHMVVDSTGLKVYGEGEWKVRQHGYDKRRTWRKLHLGVDEATNMIVSAELTKNDCGDDKLLPEILSQYSGDFHQVSADGAYDSHDCFDIIESYGATPAIPIQQNSRHKAKLKENIRKPRDRAAWEVQNIGMKNWKIKSNYHRRSLAETAMFRFKTIFGDKLSARLFKNQVKEASIKVNMLNKITNVGMPASVKIS